MFKGLSGVSFSYSGGTASGSNGWSFNIRARFDSQMAAQPQYMGITDGYKYLANMAIGLADDDYRARFGTIPGTNLSEFGQWIDSNRQSVYSDAQSWFVYVPPTQQPPASPPPPPPPPGTGTSSAFADAKQMTQQILNLTPCPELVTMRPQVQSDLGKMTNITASEKSQLLAMFDAKVAECNGDSPSFELPGGMTMWIVGGIALLLMMKR